MPPALRESDTNAIKVAEAKIVQTETMSSR